MYYDLLCIYVISGERKVTCGSKNTCCMSSFVLRTVTSYSGLAFQTRLKEDI